MGTLLICIILFTFLAHAPTLNSILMPKLVPTAPFDRLWTAICMVESSNNPSALNRKEMAIGIAQIRECRLSDFNKQTGKCYKLIEMYDPEKSKEVFYHYAKQIGINDLERIAREWNGGPKGMKYRQTAQYWNLVKQQLCFSE